MLTESGARSIVEEYLKKDYKNPTTQEILDSGAIPRLRGYRVKPGKVSDSIFGGKGEYLSKTTGEQISFENPPLETPDGGSLRPMVRTERISTHDINRGAIPFKDQILAQNHDYMRRLLEPVLGTSQFDVGLPANAVVIAAENLTQIPFENVQRAYMAKSSTTTSLYQHYMKGDRTFCGHRLPDDLIPNGPLPYVMDTPSTKSDIHDVSVGPEQLFEMGVCTREQYKQILSDSLVAFGMVTQWGNTAGLIAVDTKLEHGINREGKIVVQDEVWTMDSSRWWKRDDYLNQLRELELGLIEELNPKSFSKEFARGFSKGEEGYTDDQRLQIAVRYIEGIQQLLKEPFKADMRSWEERVVEGLSAVVERLVK